MEKRVAVVDASGNVLNVIVIDDQKYKGKNAYVPPKGATVVDDDTADFADKFEKKAGKFQKKLVEALPEGN